MSPFSRSLEGTLRHRVVYPALRMVLHNPPVDLPVDLGSVRRILLLRYDRLGDVVVTSSFIHRLRQLAPSLFIGMLTSTANQPAAALLDGVDMFHVIGGSLARTARALRVARAQRYDVVLNLVFNRTTSGGLMANLIAPRGIKVGQGAEKYRFYFNALLTLERGKMHMAEIINSIGVQVFGPNFGTTDLPYFLNDDPASVQLVERFLRPCRPGPIVFNASAGIPSRQPTYAQLRGLLSAVRNRAQTTIIVTSAPGQEGLRESLVRSQADADVIGFPSEGTATFAELVALIRSCRLLVTPDTSLVHVAGATSTPMLGIYATAFSLAEWAPRNTISEIVLGELDRPLAEMSVDSMIEGFARLMRRMPK
jgi:ADP-heptose:LPS heptosyltransferase